MVTRLCEQFTKQSLQGQLAKHLQTHLCLCKHTFMNTFVPSHHVSTHTFQEQTLTQPRNLVVMLVLTRTNVRMCEQHAKYGSQGEQSVAHELFANHVAPFMKVPSHNVYNLLYDQYSMIIVCIQMLVYRNQYRVLVQYYSYTRSRLVYIGIKLQVLSVTKIVFQPSPRANFM